MADEPRARASDPPSPPHSAGAGQPAVSGAAPGPRWRRLTARWLKRLAVTAVVVVLLSGVLLAVADHRTSQPDFCGSCHIMGPYYESWHADAHGGKLGVACIECHYAPGERATARAKRAFSDRKP